MDELTGELIHVESKMVHQQFILVNDKVKKNSFQKSRNKWGAVLWRCDDHDDVELQRRFLALLTSVSPSSPWLRRSAWWSGLASPATYVSATSWRMIQDYVTIPASLLVKSNIICMQESLFCSDLTHTSFLYIQLVLVHSLSFLYFRVLSGSSNRLNPHRIHFRTTATESKASAAGAAGVRMATVVYDIWIERETRFIEGYIVALSLDRCHLVLPRMLTLLSTGQRVVWLHASNWIDRRREQELVFSFSRISIKIKSTIYVWANLSIVADRFPSIKYRWERRRVAFDQLSPAIGFSLYSFYTKAFNNHLRRCGRLDVGHK